MEKVVNVFETGRVSGEYAAIAIYADGPNDIRQITYGRCRMTEYGNLKLLVRRYVNANGTCGRVLAPYADAIGTRPLTNDREVHQRTRSTDVRITNPRHGRALARRGRGGCMTEHRLPVHGPLSWLMPHLRGHALLFDRKSPAMYDSASGLKLLAIFVLLEGVIGPRLWLWNMTQLPMPPAWLRVPVLLALALILVRFAAKVRLSDIGLRPWKGWSTTERSYLLQVVVLANVVFSLLFANRLRRLLADPTSRATVWVLVGTSLLWGFYQEFIYRGVLQTELVRRWGGVMGILVSNVLYTFGPLHFYHFSAPPASGRLMMFVAIFAIGLFFGVLFRRSGNLWIVGIFHGIGDCYITGLGQMSN